MGGTGTLYFAVLAWWHVWGEMGEHLVCIGPAPSPRAFVSLFIIAMHRDPDRAVGFFAGYLESTADRAADRAAPRLALSARGHHAPCTCGARYSGQVAHVGRIFGSRDRALGRARHCQCGECSPAVRERAAVSAHLLNCEAPASAEAPVAPEALSPARTKLPLPNEDEASLNAAR